MSNPWDEMRQAVTAANNTLNAADRCATEIARILDGRLRRVDSAHVLRRMKKELENFNMTTGQWKP